jgi:hypothetical protein
MANTAPTTGNPISDANSQTIPTSDTAGINSAVANLAATVDSVQQQQMDTASDCLWPPSAKINIPLTLPLLPIHYTQSIQVPCLLSYGEARAVVATGIIVAGLLIIQFGLTFFVLAEVTGLVTRTLSGGGGKAAAGAGAARAVPAEAVAA